MRKNALNVIAAAGIYFTGMVTCGINPSMKAQSASGSVTPNFRNVTQLCYREHIIEKVRTEKNLQTLSLTLDEKLLFRNREQTLYHSCLLDEEKLPVRTTYFENSQNVYPDWYQPPTYTIENVNGIRSWFTTDNSYLPGGWAGATFKETEHGSYQSDGRIGGSRSFYMHHTSQSIQAYNQYAQYVASFGFLHDFVFTVPDSHILNTLASQGYEVFVSDDFVTIRNDIINVYWKIREKSMIQEVRNENNETIITFTIYKFNETFGEYLKDKEIITEPIFFENGTCAEKFTEVWFTDYSLQCNTDAGFRVKNALSEEALVSLHPNPTGEFLTVTVPEFRGPIQIRVYSNHGLMVRYFSEDINEQLTLDISLMPPGNYSITVSAGNLNWQSTFIKL
jgi:hypothetical protein